MQLDRQAYADMYGPTVGDRVRLGDTELWIQVEKDATHYGEEVKFGGGKVIRDGMGQSQRSSAESVDLVLTNTSEYCARRPQDNGCKAGTAMAHLNMDTGCDTGFHVQLRDSMTNAVVVVPGFYFSFYDIDGPTPWSHEQIVMEDLTRSQLRGEIKKIQTIDK
mgnify:CR=1 FL=1